jgi:hypothetical protein
MELAKTALYSLILTKLILPVSLTIVALIK